MGDNFIKLYDIVYPLTQERTPLYFQGDFQVDGDKVLVDENKTLDIGTYFNSFSVKKWVNYTNLTELYVELSLNGKFSVEFYGMTEGGETNFFTQISDGDFCHTFENDEVKSIAAKYDLIGIRLTAMGDTAEFFSGGYSAKFSSVKDVHIGITICTFKREQYLLPNLEKLGKLTAKNSNFNVMVVDNGQTLDEKNTSALKILPNPNYGGSGGFTRGIMEQVSGKIATHILLMDDDVVIELSTFERLHSFLRGLKDEYDENFFAGAMLSIEQPTIQTENTAHFNKLIAVPFGANFNLADKRIICKNERPLRDERAYSGWWFCCMPVKSVKKIGYPLPIFIKGDDVEYSIRLGRDLLTLNGVCVWHETFGKKFNPAMRFFNDRNMLLLNHLLIGCGKNNFITSVVARIVKHLIKDGKPEVLMLEYALKDLEGGLEKITEIPSDEKFTQVRNFPLDKNIISSICSSLCLGVKYYLNFDEHDKNVKAFVSEKLQDQKFWREFLKL